MNGEGSSWMRLRGFLSKEALQIRRDPSSIALAVVLPVVLLFTFGYGVSLDPTDVPVALVVADRSSDARELAGRFALSRYFRVVPARSMAEATELVKDGRVDGIIHVQSDFATRLLTGRRPPVQVVLDGVDANRARLIQGYAAGALQQWLALQRAKGEPAPSPVVAVDQRIWFNEAGESRNFLVPGLITLIMTLTGTLLTALVVAREWERGTMEALLVTPLRTGELLLGKILPYFGLGMAGMTASVAVGMLLFGVPMRGSFWLLFILSALFMLASLGLGLVISATVKVQFVAAQLSVIVGFLPAFFLSGLLFDLDSTPWFVRALSYVVPARYFVEIGHTLFLAGNVWSILLPDGAVLAFMAMALLGVARWKLPSRLQE